MASQPIYQFYAELNNYQPKIWRRFQVPGNITMARLGSRSSSGDDLGG